jgi:hypothetical protein
MHRMFDGAPGKRIVSFVRNRGQEPIEWQDAEPTMRRVCGACNRGWMSDLEASASPLIKKRWSASLYV